MKKREQKYSLVNVLQPGLLSPQWHCHVDPMWPSQHCYFWLPCLHAGLVVLSLSLTLLSWQYSGLSLTLLSQYPSPDPCVVVACEECHLLKCTMQVSVGYLLMSWCQANSHLLLMFSPHTTPAYACTLNCLSLQAGHWLYPWWVFLSSLSAPLPDTDEALSPY